MIVVSVGLRQCLAAARAVRMSPYWPQIRSVVRPIGTAIHRSRPPLGLLLYAAARDRRLVWRSDQEFAVLEPPISRKQDWARSDPGRTWLARLDRWWDHLVFGVPPFVALIVSVPLASVPAVGRLLAVLTVLLAVLYIMVQMIVGLLRAGRFGVSPEDSARGFHWTITLCHVADPGRLDRLLRFALDRSRELAAASMRPDRADGSHVVMCLQDGITTESARQAVLHAPSVVHAPSVARAYEAPSGVFVVHDVNEFEPPVPDAQRPIGVVPLLLVASALAVAVGAVLVAGFERAACSPAGDCSARPATISSALIWLLSQLYPKNHGLVATSWQARTLGLMMPLLGAVIVLCLWIAGWRRVRYIRMRRELGYQQLRETIEGSVRILVLVVLDIERDALIDAFVDAAGRDAEPSTAGGHPVFRLGRLEQAEVFLAQTAQGTATPAAMTVTASGLIQALRPDYVVLAGICFGLASRELDEGNQDLGDVVVSEYVQGIDHRRVTGNAGAERNVWRGERVQATSALLRAFHAATYRWTGPRVHFGTVLSSNTLVDSTAFRADLRREFPEAAAGEMELAGVYAAAASNGCGWIMAKGISDWGAGGLTDETRTVASRSAAEFVTRVIGQGTLPAPRRRQ